MKNLSVESSFCWEKFLEKWNKNGSGIFFSDIPAKFLDVAIMDFRLLKCALSKRRVPIFHEFWKAFSGHGDEIPFRKYEK